MEHSSTTNRSRVWTARWLAAGLAVVVCSAASAAAQQQPRFAERVEVPRVVLDVRVIGGQSRPVLGLGLDDFTVTIGREEVEVESVTWVGEAADGEAVTRATDGGAGERNAGSTLSAPPGRLVVFLFQKSMERVRIRGLMRFLLDLRDSLDTFTARDRVAVLSFDTRLIFWLDFTSDLAAVRRVLERPILQASPGPTQASRELSLMERLGPAAAGHTYSIERALRLLGEALEPLPGAKTVILVGHGFGRYTRLGVTLGREYDEASRALQQARATVFSLDVTQSADYHSLETGLRIVADETGGFYESTQLFTGRPLARLTGALAGHYVLIVEKPELSAGEHAIRVKLTRRQGRVLSRKTFVQ